MSGIKGSGFRCSAYALRATADKQVSGVRFQEVGFDFGRSCGDQRRWDSRFTTGPWSFSEDEANLQHSYLKPDTRRA